MKKKPKNDDILKFSNSRRVDYHQYIDSVLDSLRPNEIEEVFKLRQWLLNVKHYTEEQAADYLFKRYASLDNVPPEVWISLEEEDNQEDNDINYDEGIDLSEDELLFTDASSGQAKNVSNLASTSKILKIGGTFEVWPYERYKLSSALPAEDLFITDLMNPIEIISQSDMQNLMNLTKYIFFDQIELKDIKKCIPYQTDAIVIDPPIGYNGFSINDFYKICQFFKSSLKEAFIFIWTDSNNFSAINNAALKAELYFCDTITVEMLDDRLNYFEVVGQFGLINRSKTIYIFRTTELKRENFIHQKSRDANFGIFKPNMKSRGRLGTPQVPHQIAESMLPERRKKKIFVELWPTRLSPRPNWVYIDERC